MSRHELDVLFIDKKIFYAFLFVQTLKEEETKPVYI